MNYEDVMPVLDYEGNTVLYLLDNDVFDRTAVLVYNDGETNEEIYVLRDMQGAFPKTLDCVCDYDWIGIEDMAL